MITGQDFHAVRRHNKITQEEMAELLGYEKRFIFELERQQLVPPAFVKILSKRVGVDLLDEAKSSEYIANIDEKHKRYIIKKPKTDFFAGKTISYPPNAIT